MSMYGANVHCTPKNILCNGTDNKCWSGSTSCYCVNSTDLVVLVKWYFKYSLFINASIIAISQSLY